MQQDYYLGLDLGQTTDFTALTVVERSVRFGEQQPELSHAVRHMQRFQLGTPYGEIVDAVARLAGAPPLHGRVVLSVDQTGVGRPVVEMFRKVQLPWRVVSVTITAGRSVNVASDGDLHVPKAELVTSLLLAFQGRRLLIRSEER